MRTALRMVAPILGASLLGPAHPASAGGFHKSCTFSHSFSFGSAPLAAPAAAGIPLAPVANFGMSAPVMFSPVPQAAPQFTGFAPTTGMMAVPVMMAPMPNLGQQSPSAQQPSPAGQQAVQAAFIEGLAIDAFRRALGGLLGNLGAVNPPAPPPGPGLFGGGGPIRVDVYLHGAAGGSQPPAPAPGPDVAGPSPPLAPGASPQASQLSPQGFGKLEVRLGAVESDLRTIKTQLSDLLDRIPPPKATAD